MVSFMDCSPIRNKRRLPKRSAAMVMALVIVAAFAGVGGFLWNLERDPVIDIPSPSLPSPNAFDDYARAGKLLQDINTVNTPARHGVSRALGMSPTLQDRVLRDNASALAALRQGLTHSYMTPPARSNSVMFPYLSSDRSLTHLLALQADIQAERGDWAASAQTSLDGLQMGADIPRGGIATQMLVGSSIEAISREALVRAVDHLDEAGARAALIRLQKIDSRAVPYAQTLREEKWFIQGALLEMYRKPNWRTEILQGGVLGVGADIKTRMTVTLTGKRQVMNGYTQYIDEQIADAEAHRRPAPFDYGAADPFLRILAPVLTGTATHDSNNRAQNAFLEIELALRAYKLQHHEYPDTLAALAPNLLPSVPDDPFASNQPLRYQKTGKSYLIYSVGPDGVDDGGKAIDNPQVSSARARRYVLSGAKGDVVAGVNF
jgi:type II secretory pathway pseudopilin PulG